MLQQALIQNEQVVEATLLKKKARYAGRASKCLNLDLCYAHRILSNRTTLKLCAFSRFDLNKLSIICKKKKRGIKSNRIEWIEIFRLVVAVCAERVMGIRHPFHTRAHWSRYCTAAIVFTIVLLAGMLTFYNNFSHICVVKEFCNRTQVMAKCFDVTLDTLVYFLLRFLSPIIL